MTEELSNFPAILYSGLWLLKTLGLLQKDYKDVDVKIIVLITNVPPTFMLKIIRGDSKIEILEAVTSLEDLDNVKSDGYISLTSQVFLDGVEGVLKGIKNKLVFIKGEALKYL